MVGREAASLVGEVGRVEGTDWFLGSDDLVAIS
jgi:hypothetical protein